MHSHSHLTTHNLKKGRPDFYKEASHLTNLYECPKGVSVGRETSGQVSLSKDFKNQVNRGLEVFRNKQLDEGFA